MELFESELHVMNVLWERGDLSAKEISDILAERIGWNKNTTYTVIKKCIQKGYIERIGSHYTCHALIKRKDAQKNAVETLVSRLFGGSELNLISSLLGDSSLSGKELEEKVFQKYLFEKYVNKKLLSVGMI